MLWPDVCVVFSSSFLLTDFPHDLSKVCVGKHVLVCVCVCVCVCACVCGFMYLGEHHFKTNSHQRKQSPLDRHKVNMSNI